MTNRLHVALINASASHRKRSRQKFAEIGLTTGQPKVLSFLYNYNDVLQKNLAKMCKVEPATMTVILRNMEQSGLIYKESTIVSAGKHAFYIRLTEEGYKKAEEVEHIVEIMEEESFKNFSEDDKNTLIKLLGKMSDNLNWDED